MNTDLLQLLAAQWPNTFPARLRERIDSAFYEAFRYAETCDEPERRRVLGQLRHYRQNEALRIAGSEAGMSVAAPHTDPKGERYAIVSNGPVRIGRTSVPARDNRPRVAKHRLLLAALNGRLEPVSGNLFEPGLRVLSDDGLGVLVLTVNPDRSESQSEPARILVGLPYSSLRGWHFLEPIEELIAAAAPEVEILVPDIAFAQMKKKLRENE
ncbi:MAG: hypothetical protein H6934_06415 [Burkholderiaceae bacterium]|nr:hypothetical protein [Burkholderiaceae bacterium]